MSERDAGHSGSTLSPAVVLLALGVVFGDIGTSPLYALRECFLQNPALPVSTDSVLCVLSVIFWTLILVITVEYLVLILRADNRGEGGILALTALATRKSAPNDRLRAPLIVLGLVGASLLCADAMITPAISVLSAVEGLSSVTPTFKPLVLPIALGVLLALYLMQHHGTARIGAVFGPVTLLWFTAMGVLGAVSLARTPAVLAALNPAYALEFFVDNGWNAFAVMGSVFLVVTGGEALYADMGHFGRASIRAGWFLVVLPALVLNYFGQGAMLLREPEALPHLFYQLAPTVLQLPLVLLATAATVIASQAVISGAFSLASQAVNLGFSPRLTIMQTSDKAIGQIYVPWVNTMLMIGTLGLVLAFRESSALAAAYGVAVSTTMLATTLFVAIIARRIWGLPHALAIAVALPFLCIDLTFWSSNLLKIPSGGWLPVIVGSGIFVLMLTWKQGRSLLVQKLEEDALPLDMLMRAFEGAAPVRVPGTAVFLTSDPHGVPRPLLHNLKHNQVLHETVVLLTVEIERVPRLEPNCRLTLEPLSLGIFRATLRYGFREQPDIPAALEEIQRPDFVYDPMTTTFFFGRVTLLARRDSRSGMPLWQRHLFSIMSRNAVSAPNYFRIPPNRVVELGAQFEI